MLDKDVFMELQFAKNLYSSFQSLHENLARTRNLVGCFYKICVDKIAEFEPNVKFQNEFANYLSNNIELVREAQTNQETTKILKVRFIEMAKKYGISIRTLNKNAHEEIANGTKLGIKLVSIEDKLQFYIDAQNQLLVNALQDMTTIFEDFLADVFKHFYSEYKGCLKNKQIDYECLLISSSLEELEHRFIEKLVEDIFRKSIKEIFQCLSKEIHIDSDYLKTHEDEMLELFYRRNIHVHNKGIVNRTYIELSGNPFKFKEGDIAIVNEDYLYNAASLFLLAGADIITTIISKIKVDDENAFNEEENEIANIAFEHYLKTEDWSFSKEFYSILLKNTHLSDTEIGCYQLNTMLCDKKLGKLTLKDIKKQRWDGKRKLLQTGYYALIEDYSTLSNLLIECFGTSEQVSLNALETWPIFKEYRETDKYQETHEKIKELSQKKS